MIAVSLEYDRASRREMERLERETPRTFRAAHAAAATRAQNQLRKVLRTGGGAYGVGKFAPHHEMSRLMRPNQRLFGVLADKENVVKFRRGEGQVIGWVDRLASWASAVQGKSHYLFEAWQRRSLHQYHKGLDGYHIPAYYDRPERLVIEPFAAHLRAEFPGMVLAAYEKAVARRMKKGQAVL